MDIQPRCIGMPSYVGVSANIHVSIEVCVPGTLQLILFTHLANSQSRASRLKVHQDRSGGERIHNRDCGKCVRQSVLDIVGGFRVQVSTAEDRVGTAGEPDSGLGICRIRGFLVGDIGRDDVLAAAG